MADRSEELMQTLISKLYKTITGNDGSIKMPRNKFVTWALPGIPFGPEDFVFCSKGFVGSTAEETLNLYHQGFVASKLFDFIPDVNNQFMDASMQQTIFTSTQDTISSVYNDVLKYSRVVDLPLSEAEAKKLEKFRNLLTITKKSINILTDEEETKTEPSPLTIAYNTKMNDYIDAADEYMDLLIDAQSAQGNSPEAIRRVAEFANKSKFLRKKMEAAEMAWISQGYRNEYEQINAYINQVTQKSMVLYKNDLQNKFNASVLTSPTDGGSDFRYTTLLPGNFSTSPGWTKFTFYEGDYERHSQTQTSQWSAGGFASFGLFSIGGSASGSTLQTQANNKTSSQYVEFEFTQVPICRPWFDPAFFEMRGWTLDNLWNLNFPNQKVSNGELTPAGRLVAYPINALFIRNVKMKLSGWESESKYVNTQISGGGGIGWGPIMVGGKYSKGNTTSDFKSSWEGGKVDVPGMQLIGFINNIIPKSPNPNPAIKPEQFVGGS